MTLRRALAIVLACLPLSLFAATPLTEFVDAANKLQLAADPASVDNVTFAVGHLQVTLISGSAARLMAGNEPVGIFFKGKGSFRYDAADPAELPVVTHNAKSVAHLNVTADAAHAVLSDDFTDVLIVGGGMAMPLLAGGGGSPLGDAFKAHEALYERLRVAPRSHILAVQKFSFPSSRVVWAEFSGGRDNLVYSYDEAEDHDEGLYAVNGPRTFTEDKRVQQWLLPEALSIQPVGRDRATAGRPPFVLTALDYTLTADGDDAKATVTETIVRPSTSESVLRFDMLNEMIHKPNRPFRTFHIRSVTDDQGHPLPFQHDHDDLVVAVAGAAPAVTLKFTIDGDFLVREGGDNAWQLALGLPWFPMPRQLAGDVYTVHSIVKVKKPFVPIAPGTTIGRKEEGDFNVVENVIDKPVQFTVVQAGKYTIHEEKRGERTIRTATYGLPNERAAKQLTDLAYDLIDYYEYFLGPFPWPEFNIVQVNTYGYGQAPPATMHITNEAFNPTLTFEDQIFSEGINERFAHEIAHQYWAYVVRMPSREEQWLTESFAEYSAALALKKFRGDGVFNRLVSKWKGEAKFGAAVAPIPYANRITGDYSNSFRERFALLYNKGPYLLYVLNKEVGDTTFLTFLKSYTKTFNFKPGTTKDVAGLLGFITKKDYRPFFDQYFWGTAMP